MTTLMEEIAQQPAVLSGLRKFYTSPGAIPSKALRAMVKHWPPTVVFTGMGSSMYAAYPAQAYLTSHGVRALIWETAELVDHHMKILGPDTLLVVVSQSGETAEALRLLGALTGKDGLVAVCNMETSSLAQRANLLLPLMAGRAAPVGTKTYTCAVAVLMYLAVAIARKPPHPLTQALMHAIEAQEKIIDRHDDLIPPTVEFFDKPHYIALLSRGADLASVYQGALLFKEVAKMGAEPMSAAQFRHGPMEIINPAHRYIIFARQSRNQVRSAKPTIACSGWRGISASTAGASCFTPTCLLPTSPTCASSLLNRSGWGWEPWLIPSISSCWCTTSLCALASSPAGSGSRSNFPTRNHAAFGGQRSARRHCCSMF